MTWKISPSMTAAFNGLAIPHGESAPLLLGQLCSFWAMTSRVAHTAFTS